MTTYCAYVQDHPEDGLNKVYHDTQYGFPLRDDDALFERLSLEIFQAGLSWVTILKKAENFRRAFEGFNIDLVASYADAERERLLADRGIVRNRLKVNAIIENARRVQALRAEDGSFKAWLDAQHPLSREEWTRLFRATFVFTGGEIVGEFLLSTGYLPGAHEPSCPIFYLISRQNPPWQSARV